MTVADPRLGRGLLDGLEWLVSEECGRRGRHLGRLEPSGPVPKTTNCAVVGRALPSALGDRMRVAAEGTPSRVPARGVEERRGETRNSRIREIESKRRERNEPAGTGASDS